MRIAVFVQVGAYSRFEFISEHLSLFNNKYNPQIFFCCNKDEPEAVKILDKFPDAIMIRVENLGMDLWKFLATIKVCLLSYKDFDLVVKLHTKKPSKWTSHLLDLILPYNFERVLDKFKDPEVGSVTRWECIAPILKTDNNYPLIKEITKIYNKKIKFPKKIHLDLNLCGIEDKIDKNLVNNPNFISSSNDTEVRQKFLSLVTSTFYSSEDCDCNIVPKFSMGTIFVIRWELLEKYFPIKIIDFFLHKMKEYNETGYYTDMNHWTVTHSLERVLGLISFLDSKKLVGI